MINIQNIVFAYSGATFVYGGNTYVRDFGPNGFHMRFGAAGAAPVPQLDGSLLFSGAQYAYFDGDLTRYYAKMPTGENTLLLASKASAGAAYACWDGANSGLLSLQTGQRIRWYTCSGAAMPYIATPTSPPVRNNTDIVLCLTIETTPRGLHNGAAIVPTWIVGGYGTTVYNTATIPRIGMYPNGAGQFNGTLSYLCLLRGAVLSSDMAELSAMMMNGRKPFCWR